MSTKVTVNSGGRTPTWLVVLLTVLAAAFCAYTSVSSRKSKAALKQQRMENRQLSATIGALSDTAALYQVRLADGRKVWAAKASTLYLDKCNAQRLLASREAELRRMGVRLSDAASYADFNTATADTVRVPVYIDSVRSLHAEYRDSFAVITATLRSNRTSYITYCIRDSFTLINHTTCRRFLFFRWHRRDTYTLIARNPRTVIRGLQVIKVIE